jgi:uncharacterized protein (UPF0335 family)
MSEKSAGEGHNSAHRVEGAQLRAFCERIERLIEERQTISDDIKDVKAEAAAAGYDKKVLTALIRRRAQDKAEREEFEALLQLYIDHAG